MKRTAGASMASYRKCCPAALDLPGTPRHRPPPGSSRGLPMRDLFIFIRKLVLGAGIAAVFGVLACGQAAQAANFFEMNFYLSGPRYDGNLPPCESALGKISSNFADK